jgi:SAM-dependent methyltransferase
MTVTACKICAQDTRLIHDEQFAINYYYCSNCGFIFMDEAKILPPQQERERYLKHMNTPEDSGYADMLKTFIKTGILPFHGNIKTALDFGSGPEPVLAALLKEMGYEVDIYDIYFAPEPVYRNRTYDLITCTEVLEHLRNPLETLKMLKDHLQPGGILAVMTMFHPLESGKRGKLPGEMEFKDWWYRRDPTHISFFRPETFRYIAELLGMSILMMDKKNTISLT